MTDAENRTFTVYHGSTSYSGIEKAREHAPSVAHGNGWTPYKMTAWEDHPQPPYFCDNGAYTDSFHAADWREMLDSIEVMPREPDFAVLPDVLDDAEATMQMNRRYVDDCRDRGIPYYAVAQPGAAVERQIRHAVDIGAAGVFVGGEVRWQRAYGGQLVMTAHDYGLDVHIGNPGGADGLEWAYEVGFDSADTTTVVQNQYWHYLQRLETAEYDSHHTASEQSSLAALAEEGAADD